MKKIITLMLWLMVANAWALGGGIQAQSNVDSSSTQLISNPPIEVAQAFPGDDMTSTDPSDDATSTDVPTPMATPPNLSVASTPVPNNAVGEHFLFQLDGGVAPAISSAAATVFNSNLGFDASLSYAFDNVFSIGLETGFYDFGVDVQNTTLPSSSSANMAHIPALIVMQIYFGDLGAPIQPYLAIAGGLAFDNDNLKGGNFAPGVVTNWVNFELDPAVGIAFALNRKLDLFLQGKWAMDFGPNSGSGAQSADSPIMFLPLQLGLSFNL